MPMQQIMRWGHDFLRIRGGMFNLEPFWGKSMCQKETPKNVHPLPYAFMFSSSLMFWGAGDVLIIHPSHFSVFFLVVHAQSIIWLSSKHCGPFWSFFIPFCSCILCIHPACRTMFCSRLITCYYHPQPHKGLGSPLFAEWMSSGDHLILWERVVICGFLSVVVQWSPLSQSEWNPILLCWHCDLLFVHFFLVLNWFGVELGLN